MYLRGFIFISNFCKWKFDSKICLYLLGIIFSGCFFPTPKKLNSRRYSLKNKSIFGRFGERHVQYNPIHRRYPRKLQESITLNLAGDISFCSRLLFVSCLFVAVCGFSLLFFVPRGLCSGLTKGSGRYLLTYLLT